jgi:hypothetical protein
LLNIIDPAEDVDSAVYFSHITCETLMSYS